MTAAEVYQSVSNGGVSDFADAVELLGPEKTWCLIGGLAVNCYVEPVYTMDADVVVISRSLAALKVKLETAGFEVVEFEHSLNAQRPPSGLRLQVSTDARYQDFVDHAREAEVLGVKVRLATLEDIIRGKVWAWEDVSRRVSKRKKDELDLLRIAEAYPDLHAQIPAPIVEQLHS